MSIASPQDVRRFWLQDLEPKDWYVANDVVDQRIRERFLDTWEEAKDGGLQDWLTSAEDLLAYIIVTDQFPRNMFRQDGRSFATDALAVAATQTAIASGWDTQINEPERQFVYVTLMHAEDLVKQDQAIELFATRMSPDNQNLLHAHAHRWVIASFGRFPYRNAALQRETTPQEQSFLDLGGYRFALSQIESGKT